MNFRTLLGLTGCAAADTTASKFKHFGYLVVASWIWLQQLVLHSKFHGWEVMVGRGANEVRMMKSIGKAS